MASKEEKDIYYSLRNITSILYRLYRNLYTLEVKKESSSLEYEKTLKLIEFYTRLEDQYYERLETLVKEDGEIIERMYVNNLLSTESTFSPEKQLSDISYIIFHDIKENDIIPMRMANKLFETSVITSENSDEISQGLYNGYESQKGTYFIDILDAMSKDPDFKEFRNQLIKAKYKVAFINKRRSPLEPNDEFVVSTANEMMNAQEILNYARKMYNLNESSIKSPSNARRLMLSMAYIRANMLQMSEVGMQALYTLLSMGESCGDLNPREGKKLFDEILKYEKDDKETFKSKGNTLKRKF